MVGLLARDPALHREALKRGKAFTRARQNRERIQQKLTDDKNGR